MRTRPGGLTKAWEEARRTQGSQMVELVCALNADNTARERVRQWDQPFRGVDPPRWLCRDGQSGRQWLRRKGKTISFEEYLPECREVLRLYVDRWLQAGKNAHKLRDTIGEMTAPALTHVRRSLLVQEDGFVSIEPVGDTTGIDERVLFASWYFLDLLLNPFRDLLAGPCERCCRYFLNASGHMNKKWCSQRCKEGAKKRARRTRELASKLSRAVVEIRMFASTSARRLPPFRGDWKREVARRIGVTPKWLTRYINQKELSVPKALLKSARLYGQTTSKRARRP
jgi:hypothetical protein